MILYVLLKLSCMDVLAKLLPKCKKSVLTSISACCQRLIINRSLIYCVHVLLCTLTSKSIICGMSLMFRLMSNVLKACWSGSGGQKNGYRFNRFLTIISLNFLIPRSKYVLHNVIQSWGISGCVSWQTTQSNSSYSSMNPQQTGIYSIKNMTEHLLKPYLLKYRRFECNKRRSILLAYISDDFITWEIEYESFSQELFEDFIEKKHLP